MERFITAVALATVLACAAAPAAALSADYDAAPSGNIVANHPGSDRQAVPDEYDDMQSHPLRVAAYVVHPIGYAVEWLVFRPIHSLVSCPPLQKVFGHRPHGDHRID